MTAARASALGGYFELERSRGCGLDWWSRARWFESARAALGVAIMRLRPTAVRLPWFACGAIAQAVESCGAEVRRYALDDSLGISRGWSLADDEVLITIDYFGLCAPSVHEALRRFGNERVIVDAAQSLFQQPSERATIVFSPRKFVGVPDGGALISPFEHAEPTLLDESASRRRCRHLLQRLSEDPEGGYAAYREAEASLDRQPHRAMSRLTRRLLDSIDFDDVARRRSANFDTLRRLLPPPVVERGDAVPLCYPLRVGNASRLRAALAQQRVYCPAYWPDSERGDDAVASMLLDEVVYLPCDQRYGAGEMQRLAELVQRMSRSG